MKAPQVFIIVLYAFSLGGSMINHGKERTGRTSFWGSLLYVAVVMVALWLGGFFG